MDGDANRLVPPGPPLPSNLVRPVLNAKSTSLSSSQPNFLGHFKAAFKRHRPLGSMPVNTIRPKRLVGSQREASRTTSSNVMVGSDTGTKNFDDTDLSSQEKVVKDSIVLANDVASVVKTSQECVSISPPSVSGITFEDDFNPLALERDRSKYAVANKDIVPVLPTHVECEQVEGKRRDQVSTAVSATSMGADRRMATGLENLSSHMSSLAMTELERDASKQVESLIAVNTEQKHQNKEAHANLRSYAAVSDLAKRTTFVEDQLHQLIAVNTEQENQNKKAGANLMSDAADLAKRTTMVEDQLHQLRNFLGQPAGRYSAVGLSGATTTSVHSTAAPMLNSMTCCPHPQSLISCQVAPESLGDFIMDSQHMRQGNMQQHVRFSSKHESGELNDGRASASQTSAAATSNRIKEHRIPSKKECNLPKEIDIPKNPSNVTSKLDDERGSVIDAIEVRSQDVSSKNTCSDVKLVPSKQEIQEKVAVSKGASGPRKRTYDPDLFFKVNGKLYQRLGKIGSGGSSEVHKVISSDCKIYALKKIKLKGRDYATAYGFCQEIEYLNRLKSKNNIIQLIDYELTDKYLLSEVMSGTMSNKDGRVKDDGYIYMVLEYGEVDLAHMLSQKWKEMDGSNQTIDENWLRFYWQQILQAVNTIHEERIVHSDLKPANFLLVKGSLKLIDFGIAKAIMSDTTNIQRDSQVGTLSYMSPEAFMCNEKDANGNTIKCGRPSDIWSLGCILYQMVYGRTPFSEYKTFWAKFKVITDPNHQITYEPVSNPWLLDLMKKCLAWDRNERWRIPELIKHPFLVPPSSSNLLQRIAEAADDDQEASTLCSELQRFLSSPVSSSLSRDEQCNLLRRISNLSSQLRESLQKPKSGRD